MTSLIQSFKTWKPPFFYGYVIVATGFLIMMVIHGSVNTFGVFFNSLLNEFDMTRASLSMVSSVAFFVMGTAAIVMGILNDRFGPRLILSACALLFGLGHLFMYWVTAPWQMYLCFVLIGIGFSPSDVVPLSTVVRWFVKKRGAMTGIMKVGTGIGIMVIPLLAGTLIKAVDWRNAYLILGIIIIATVIPLAQLLKRDPKEIGELADGERKTESYIAPDFEEGLTLRQGLRTRQLWMVCGLYTVLMFCAQSILVHIVQHGIDLGIDEIVAAGFISAIGASSIAGRLTMGFTGDRMGHRKGMTLCFSLMVIALIWIQFAEQAWMLYLFAIVYGFNHGGFFSLLSPLIAGLFGTRAQGALLGIVICCGATISALSPILTGWIADTTGSYRIAFIILLGLSVVGLTISLILRPITKKEASL